MIQTTIFPNSHRDVESCILFVTDPNSLRILTCVNKTANFVISNEYFQKLFNRDHPYLAQLDNVFPILTTCYPTNCWKVACCAFYNSEFKVNNDFLMEANPIIIESVKSQKNKMEIELKEICGSYYEDPNSQIDQAWKAYKKYDVELEEMSSTNVAMFNMHKEKMKEFYSTGEYMTLAIVFAALLTHNPEKMKDLTFEKLINSAYAIIPSFPPTMTWQGEDGEPLEFTMDRETIIPLFKENLFHDYYLLIEDLINFRKTNELKDHKLPELYKKYRNLEEKRIHNSQCLLPSADMCLAKIDPSLPEHYFEFCFTYRCESFLRDEFNMGKKVELAPKVLPALKECSHLIQILIDPTQVDPEVVKRLQESTQVDRETIRCAINSLPTNEMTAIWRDLYTMCANEVHEDEWSENHFHEFLPTLKYLVDIQIRDCEFPIEWIKNDSSFEKRIIEFIKMFYWELSSTAPLRA